jgi:cytochrome c nitrite reductase small subunit
MKRYWIAIAAAMVGPGMASGAETTVVSLRHPFEGQGSFVDMAERTTAVVAILILLIVLTTLLVRSGRLRSGYVTFLRFVGLFVLPIVLVGVGTFANFEGSKRVEFCHSCHTAMDLYVDDMKDPQSETLAARHYKNRYIQDEQCYHCHADYGVNGTIDAKLRGLVHLYYWVTHSATARGEKQIHLYGYYPNDLCLHCHAGSQRFLKVEEHLDAEDDLLKTGAATGKPLMSCLECHPHDVAHLSLAAKRKRQKGSP